ncbi:DUF350 domain-containing protein [Pseudonocardia nantongensis]|uniref:DUF350 domain-containing protein n=1 Tax=Pseudonocardia nantongensis TaxID=1181885 RepID=UPI00397BC700
MILAQALDATYWGFLTRGIGAILLYAVIGTLMMLIGFWAIDLTTPGKLPRMVRAGLPNAVTITAAGMISMAFIIVLAIYSSYGSLLQGMISSLVFGLVGIIAQVAAVRLLEWVTGIDIGEVIQAEEPRAAAKVVAAAHLALGLIVAVAVF